MRQISQIISAIASLLGALGIVIDNVIVVVVCVLAGISWAMLLRSQEAGWVLRTRKELRFERMEAFGVEEAAKKK